MSLPRLKLRKDLSRLVAEGHPWIFRDALDVPSGLVTGTAVDVLSPDGGFLGRGLYEAGSPIAVRIASRDRREKLDEAFVRRRIQAALRLRAEIIDPTMTDSYRALNGEGDYLPGVVVDRYGEAAVVRFDGEAARIWEEWVGRAVTELLPAAHVVERRAHGPARVVTGDPPPRLAIREGGVRFAVDVRHGHKTGFFFDQRENRSAIRRFAIGQAVADLYCYTGGFGVHAALAGARKVTMVDRAAPAIAAARENLSLNGVDPKDHETVQGDAMAWLRIAGDQGRRFGLVITDPPSLAPSERKVGPALTAYRELHARALSVLEPDGVLAAASCSSHVTLEQFLSTLRTAAASTNRPLQVLEVRGQPADHPTPAGFPEGRYLKFVLLRAA